MRIRRIDIENFRGIKCASWRLPKDQTFFALIGPGDSTKTTLLTAIERTLHDRPGMMLADTDFYGVVVEQPIRIRVAVDDLPDELIAMDAFGAFLAGIDEAGEWSHDPVDESGRCVIVELLVEADLEPLWRSYQPPLDGVGSPRRWADAGLGEDASDRARADVVPELGRFSLDAAMPPVRVLAREPYHQLAKFVIDRRPSGSVRVGPLLCDETAMPGQQRGWCHDAVSA
jgi:hypothetical protein